MSSAVTVTTPTGILMTIPFSSVLVASATIIIGLGFICLAAYGIGRCLFKSRARITLPGITISD